MNRQTSKKPAEPHFRYQVIPMVNHQRTSSVNLERPAYQYITPATSPMKFQGNNGLTNHLSTPIRNTSNGTLRQSNYQGICKTADKRPNTIALEGHNAQIYKNLSEENKELLQKQNEIKQTNDFLMKKMEILLKENQSLNAIVKDLGKELIDTKQKLRFLIESEDNSTFFPSQLKEMEIKIQILSKENERLIKMIEIQNREESSLNFLEEKIDCLLKENMKLNSLVKKEKEISSEYQKQLTEIKKNENLEFENKILEYKMNELHQKLQVIFEDNDKLDSMCKTQQKEYNELKQAYEKETEKNSHQISQINELLNKIEDLKTALDIKQSERDMEMQKSNEENESLYGKFMVLLGENEKLNECLNNLLEISLQEEENEKKGFNKSNEKIDLLLKENAKLQTVLENKYEDQENVNEVFEENQQLKIILSEKERNESFWKEKYQDLEKKIKNLF